jgi:2-polyprenyl-3-methyl-5-hydroxy-6-metoxy-1,4-benzoquinol methylase
MDTSPHLANEETRRAWDANASFWDEHMGEGNDFANLLCAPALMRLLAPQAGQHILDIACGNGLFARRLAEQGAAVTALDFSSELIRLAIQRTSPEMDIQYLVRDATCEADLLVLGERAFDSALCNMALFDMAEIEPLFNALPRLLKPGGVFVFTLTHPVFNNSSAMHVVEESDVEGSITTRYAIKVSRYMTCSQALGLAIRGQPAPQVYFDRPLHVYLNLGFRAGFVLDGFEERAFPPDHPQGSPLGWGGRFSEIPPVLAARFRLRA